MSVPSYVAAKAVCELTDWKASNLEIHKKLYIAYMVLLGRSDGSARLVDEAFQAWDYGPVLPTLYHHLKAFGSGPVRNVFHGVEVPYDLDEIDVIEEAVEMTAPKTPGQLIAITHWEQGAWAKNYEPGARRIVIPDHDILEEYRLRTRSTN